MRNGRVSFVVVFAVFALLAACSGGNQKDKTGTGSAEGVLVGPDGGEVELPGGGALIIPPGALSVETEIHVRQIDAPASDRFTAIGGFVAFEPSGLEFEKAVEVRFPFETDAPELAGIAWSEDASAWDGLVARVDLDAMTVSANIRHFSTGGPVVWLDPNGACCSEGTCRTTTFDDCNDGAFLGRGIPCSLASGDVCTNLRCCRSGASYVMMVGDTCPEGRTTVDIEACTTVCCGDPDRFEPTVTARGNCRFEIAATDPHDCRSVCCTLSKDGEVYDTRMMAENLCRVMGDAEYSVSIDPDLTMCPICCADNWGLKVFSECPEFQQREPSDCETVCCLSSWGIYSWTAAGACEDSLGSPADATNCQCETDDACDDGDPCTLNVCSLPEGVCQALPLNVVNCGDGCFFPDVEECEADAHCPNSEDGERCVDCACVMIEGCLEDSDCLDPTPDDCIGYQCSPNGVCEEVLLYGTPCDDGDPCTTGGECVGGVCEGLLCETPPGPRACYNLPGTCNAGEGCSYFLADECAYDMHCQDGEKCHNCTCVDKFWCESDSNCLSLLLEHGECVDFRCEDEMCVRVDLEEGTSCGEGEFCYHTGECDGRGNCVQEPFACDSPIGHVSCYVVPGECSPWGANAGQCVYEKLGECGRMLDCDQGEICARDCTCQDLCIGAEDCPDEGDPNDCLLMDCVEDMCVQVAAPYQHTCDDQDPCTEGDFCDVDGVCKGFAKDCSSPPDGEPCLIGPGVCEAGSCRFETAEAGTSCGESDACYDYACDEAGVCKEELNCPSGNACQVPACVSGMCGFEPAPDAQCATHSDCEAGVCDPSTCQCEPVVIPPTGGASVSSSFDVTGYACPTPPEGVPFHDIGNLTHHASDPLLIVWDAEYDFTDYCVGTARAVLQVYKSQSRWMALPTYSFSRYTGKVVGMCNSGIASGDIEEDTIVQAELKARIEDRNNYGCCTDTVAMDNKASGLVRVSSYLTQGRMVELPFHEMILTSEAASKLTPYRFKALAGQQVYMRWRAHAYSKIESGVPPCSGTFAVSYDVSLEGDTLSAKRQATTGYVQGVDSEGVRWCSGQFTATANAIYHVGIASPVTCVDTGDDPEQEMPAEFLEVDIW